MTFTQEELHSGFPNLETNPYKIIKYMGSFNCFALVNGDTNRWWCHRVIGSSFYWPPGLAPSWKLENMKGWFERQGYVLCHSEDFETGFEKVALYTNFSGDMSHVTRQHIEAGVWLSKLGKGELIAHNALKALACLPHFKYSYGAVGYILKRPIISTVIQ